MAEEKSAQNAEQENADDAVISMVDYLKEEQELEDDANAVLGDCDQNQCTYSLGYRSRQALYACYTCETKEKVPAGVCLACSYECHEGHDLYELYTKRNFCCDCGNSKFTDLKCKLCPEKDEYNSQNQYNQNFKGLYCVCSRPYPDPEDEIEDEMIQCVVCEDWYHGRHLGECQPPSDFSEMICVGCMGKHDFLWSYNVHSKETGVVASDSSASDVDVEKSKSAESTQDDSKTSVQDSGETPATAQQSDSSVSKASDSTGSTTDVCLLAELQKREVTVGNGATFWPQNFRSKLCKCDKCKAVYKCEGVEYLADESDTVWAYEKRGVAKAGPSTHQDREKQVLDSMNRVQQIEMVQGFNDMKSALSDYLKHFAENGKVVRAEDIREFFQQMEQRKRQKTDHTPAYFCK